MRQPSASTRWRPTQVLSLTGDGVDNEAVDGHTGRDERVCPDDADTGSDGLLDTVKPAQPPTQLNARVLQSRKGCTHTGRQQHQQQHGGLEQISPRQSQRWRVPAGACTTASTHSLA